jgi:hypothetical protein
MARKRPIRGANSDRWIRRQEATRQAGVLPSRHAGIRRGSDETDRPSLGGARFGYRTSGIAFETGHPAATLKWLSPFEPHDCSSGQQGDRGPCTDVLGSSTCPDDCVGSRSRRHGYFAHAFASAGCGSVASSCCCGPHPPARQTSRRGHPLNPLARDAEVAGDLPRAAIAPTSADMIALREPTTQTTRVRRVCVAYPKQGIAGRPPALPSSRSSVDVSSFAARVHQYASG